MGMKKMTRTSGTIRAAALAACAFSAMITNAYADPLSITDLTGRTIKLEKPAERIVVMPIPYTSTVIAVDGGTDKLMAMHPEAKLAIEEGILGQFFPAAKDIRTDIVAGGASRGFAPNVEAIAALNPDLVLQWGDLKEDGLAPLINAGINTAALLYGNEDHARKIITLVGTAMGRTEKLDMLIKWREDTAKAIADSLAGLTDAEKPKVAYFFYTTPELQTEGKGTFTDWQIGLTGGINVAAGIDGWGSVGLEQVAAWDPDVILLGSFERDIKLDRVYDDPVLGATKAAKAKRVYKVPVGGYRWDPPSQDSPLMWMWLASVLHPDRVKFDVRAATAEWYKKIYGHEPTPDQIDAILHLAMNSSGADYSQFARK